MFRVRAKLITCIFGLPLLFTGCHSKTAPTPENFMVALNARFVDHPECLMPDSPHFPFETTDPEKTKQMDALVTAQLLTVHKEASIRVSRYTLTAVGSVAAPRFCYGHRHATSINSFTPPAQANGFPETQVSYQYEITEVPVWAKVPEVQTAFPKMAQAISGSATDKATLARTMAGWQVPD